MKKSPHSIDGFTVRRRNKFESQRRNGIDDMQVPSQYLLKDADAKSTPVKGGLRQPNGTTRTVGAVATGKHAAKGNGYDFDMSLPDEDGKGKKKRRFRLKPSKKIIKIVMIILLVLALVVGGYFGWKLLSNAGRVFKGNLFNAAFSNKPLKTDQYGRTNIVIFGTSEDDPGHDGAQLTDSIMIASIDQKKHDGFLVSVPRDLWVKYGKACNAGFEGKINEVYMCGKGEAEDEAAGSNALRTKVSEVFGIDLQYSVHVNYGVVKGVVDAVGGVDIVIESPDPRGILDRNFDWRCRQKCNLVKWPNGPAHLNGEHALFLAQARGEGFGYGLPRGNFDREENQRKIMIALQKKATSVGFLSNPIAVTQLLDSLGDNVRTNIDAEEIKSFIQVAKETDAAKIASLTLLDPEKPLMTTGNVSGSSVVRPVKGIYDFTDLQAFMRLYLSGDSAVINEKAKVDVLNGSGTPGVAQKRADLLSAEGITIAEVENAPAGEYGKFKLYDLSAGKKPATKAKLEKNLGVTALTTPLPAGITSTSDFVIIIGANGVN